MAPRDIYLSVLLGAGGLTLLVEKWSGITKKVRRYHVPRRAIVFTTRRSFCRGPRAQFSRLTLFYLHS